MSAETRHKENLEESDRQKHRHESDQEVSDALMLLFRLPDEAIASIRESAKSLQVSFSEAALHTGLVTQRELDQALDYVRRQERNAGRGIVEEALRRRSTRREVALWTGERVFPGKELILAHQPDHQRSEALRSLRTELLMRTSGRRGAGIFAFLSPCAKEGRSQLCAELAIAFAQLGSRTLLVDADLRRPHLHALFGADNQIGLAQALDDGSAPRVYGVEGAPQMQLLTSGALSPNPLELLSGSRFERLVAEWRRSYEFVLIDTPPASEFSDGLPVATAAGNVVLLGRKNSTSFSVLTELCRKLETTHARVVGAVINTF
jgi:protein-tyrosine kinase